MLEIIGLACFVQLFTYLAEPIQDLKLFLGIKKYYVMNCSLCFGWWIGLAYFIVMNPMYCILSASIVSVLSEVMSIIINKIK